MKQEHSEELAINCQEETEGSVYKQSSEFLKEGGDKEEALLGLRLAHTHILDSEGVCMHVGPMH